MTPTDAEGRMDVVVHVERTSPPCGRLDMPHGEGRAFVGWLELLALLEAALGELAVASADVEDAEA